MRGRAPPVSVRQQNIVKSWGALPENQSRKNRMIDLTLANSVSDNLALGNHLVGPKPSRLQGTIIENSIENSRVASDSASSLLSIAS
jgi:hypothetical protein